MQLEILVGRSVWRFTGREFGELLWTMDVPHHLMSERQVEDMLARLAWRHPEDKRTEIQRDNAATAISIIVGSRIYRAGVVEIPDALPT